MQKQGRGQGHGIEYKPWLTIRDVNSSGFKHRIKGWKTERTHHLFSNLELSFFFWLEWLPNVVDIRERFPLLPIKDTIEIAAELGFKHPFDYKKNEHIVMTTDFLVNHKIQNQTVLKAYSVMTSNGLTSTRVLRKTFIERTFWRNQGIEFIVVTEKDIPKELTNNVDWLCVAKDFEFLPIKDYKELLFAESVLSKNLKGSSIPIAKSCLLTDAELGLKPGSSIQLVKHFIVNRYWDVDLTKRLTTNLPIQFERNEEMLRSLQQEMIG
jgi:hypothetical protein